jgi:HAMP domain-containing protein
MIVRQLTATYVLLVALAIAGFTVPVALTLTGQMRADTESAVGREAETAARLLAGDDEASRRALVRLVDAYQRETAGRLDVQLGAGHAAAPLPMPAAGNDAAFAAALAGKPWRRWGDAPALGQSGLVLAVPARDGQGRVVGAVRISYPSAPIERRIHQIWLFRGALAAVVLAAATALGLVLARRLTRPLRELTATAAGLRDGNLDVRAPETGPEEVRTLARTLNNATETIEVLVRSQRAFVADASHQLRTPLTAALRLALDNVADGADHSATVREDLERATAEVVRMTRLVNGLLALARAEADVAAVEPVPVGPVIAGRLEVWRPVAAERRITLRSVGDDGTLNALTTPGHLEQDRRLLHPLLGEQAARCDQAVRRQRARSHHGDRHRRVCVHADQRRQYPAGASSVHLRVRTAPRQVAHRQPPLIRHARASCRNVSATLWPADDRRQP